MRHTLWLLALAAAPVLAAGDDLAVGKALFVNGAVPACAVCHTLKDAGTTGEVGPVLDELKPSADRVAAALRNGVGLMPSYKDSLTDAQIRAIARYVASVSGR
ncbi:cytochrome c [Rhizobacter sp. Root1221]|uniref:SorU family sulfite dehydrogenase c-type cytochrome subunit n=1 Tax=Rhizobacter sp. Root1221 TaxID=1736433 RepID=UPI0006F972E9|nr:cytochrome c [Rhizobacter sp. Root1221]KQV99883.1 sulfide dehydrogenase [Rhizobacter sp. Root1221]